MIHLDLSLGVTTALQTWTGLFVPQERIFVLYLLTSLAIAWFVWRAEIRREKEVDPAKRRRFLSYVFDPSIYKHKSSWQDYFIFYINGAVYYAIISQFVLSQRFFAALFRKALLIAFGPLEHPAVSGWVAIILFTLVSAMLYDLAVYVTHLLTHKVHALWVFHKVHHSAEVLTPVTLFRMHPVDLFLNSVMSSLFLGIGMGVFSYLALREVTDIQILGLNVFVFAFYLFGYNLRHSHVWLHYPAWLSAILISPAQHQVHHSTAMKHRDKNMGLMLSIWDRLFGTLYDPKEREHIIFGIDDAELNPYISMKQIYIEPFKECFDLFRARPAARSAGVLAGLVSLVWVYFQMTTMADGKLVEPLSPYMEELTWTEIYQAEQNGYDTVIIPVGGTEQGGPHMVLGKHNYIVHYTAGEIAKRLGNALVAPVIAYVPQGDITPKLSENMKWPGTVGVPDAVLEGTLYWAAYSYRQHGFKYIYFIGDHGLNQVPQQVAADKLIEAWGTQGVLVANISKYYDPSNGQVQWLEKHGFKDQDIGMHAAIRDTSELMYVHPEGIRSDPVIIPNMPDGIQGNPHLATKDIGKEMIELKISAAVSEINDIRRTRKAPPSPYMGHAEKAE